MRPILAALVTLNLAACAHSAGADTTAPAPQASAPAPASEQEPLSPKTDEQRRRDASAAYDAACTAALAGKTDEALALLERAADAGFAEAAHMAKDPDLDSLRAEPAYARIAEKVAANDAKLNAAQDPALRDELLKMMESDQAARKALIRSNFQDEAAKKHLREVDTANTARMKEIVAEKGWPGKSLVGQRAALAAWLLVQHADHDRDFQRQMLPLLEQAVARGEADGRNFAYLTDRVLLGSNMPQRYGTQFHEVDGKLVPRPIEDEANVDARRAAVGLGPLSEYAAQMERMRQRSREASSNDRVK